MWIDAICINQANGNREKPRQIALMDQIYTKALKVAIYAGDSKNDSDLALSVISNINDELQQQLDSGQREQNTFWTGCMAFWASYLMFGKETFPSITIYLYKICSLTQPCSSLNDTKAQSSRPFARVKTVWRGCRHGCQIGQFNNLKSSVWTRKHPSKRCSGY